MSEKRYDLGAGDLSLNFANTNNWHASNHPEEMLVNYDDLVTWGEQAGLLTPEQAVRVRRLAADEPARANRAYLNVIDLREAIYHIFSKRYAGQPVHDEDLDLLNAAVREAMGNQILVPTASGFAWEWTPETDGVNLILWPVARAAATLLTSELGGRVRECEDDRGCGFLFIDQSKNHSRRWCSMESCGNRAKARRHYARAQQAEI